MTANPLRKWLRIILLAGVVSPLAGVARPLAPGHSPAAVKRLQPAGDLSAQTRLNLAIGLPLRNGQALRDLMRNVYDPASPDYHHFLTPDQFAAQFGPTAEQYQAVTDFARSNHLTVTRTHSNRMLLNVSGAASDVGKAFGVRLRTYHRPAGSGDFFAPDREPSVGENVPILDVSGLSNYRPPHPQIRASAADTQKALAHPNTGSGSGGAYMGGDFRAAYLPGVLLTGAGQSIGLVEFDGFYASDITNYESKAGMAAVPVQTVLIDSYSGSPTTAGNDEVSLDIEMAIAMAPGLSSVISYEAGPNGNPNDVLNRMATDNQAKQLACSWTWGGGPTATTDQIFQQMALEGQSFFCASGDSDAYSAGALDDASNDNTPADSAYITSVGGTTLTTSGPGGSWVSETVWNWGGGTGSSGGTSSYYAIPVWQQGISMSANGGSATMRNIPDVALTGNNIYVIYGNGSSGTYGGTSCATPLWAAFVALVNQQAANYGLTTVGFVNPGLYAIAQGTNYASLFHDITTGNNTSSTSPSEFYATTGYDLCTGWGTPGGAGLINALAPPPDPMSVSPTGGFSASGLVGGPFSLNSESFSISNSSASALTWSVSNSAPWLGVSAGGGTLPGASATTLTISLGSAASNLASGAYTAAIGFADTATGFVATRQFILAVTSQMVQNGGFEAGSFTNWSRSGNTNYSQVTTSPAYVHSGKYGAQFGPSTTLGYLAQTLPTVPGRAYLLSFWLTNPKTGSTPNQFNVSWGGATLLNQTNVAVTPWTNLQFVVNAASSGTVLQFGFRNDPQYFGLDDVSVVPIASPELQSLTKVSTTVSLSLGTTAGVTYQIQYTTNLTQMGWMNLGQPFTATNSVSAFTDGGAVDPQRYYRMLVCPPQ